MKSLFERLKPEYKEILKEASKKHDRIALGLKIKFRKTIDWTQLTIEDMLDMHYVFGGEFGSVKGVSEKFTD